MFAVLLAQCCTLWYVSTFNISTVCLLDIVVLNLYIMFNQSYYASDLFKSVNMSFISRNSCLFYYIYDFETCFIVSSLK